MSKAEEGLTLQNQAYVALLDDIINCNLKPGQKISLRDLEEMLGYGRTPIRESVVRLVQQGIVYTVPQSGTFISKIDLADAANARYVREALETNIAVECCARATEADLSRLELILDQQVKALSADDEDLSFKLDNTFHQELFTIAGRIDVWRWIESLSIHLNRYRRIRLQVQQLDSAEILRQHKRIYEAIVSRDTDSARYLTHVHLHLMAQEKADVLKAFPDYFA